MSTTPEVKEKFIKESILYTINNWLDLFFKQEREHINRRTITILFKSASAYAKEHREVSLKYAYVGNSMLCANNVPRDNKEVAIIHASVQDEAYDILNQILKMVEDEKRIRQYLSILITDGCKYHPFSNPVKTSSPTIQLSYIWDKNNRDYLEYNSDTDKDKVPTIWHDSYIALDTLLMYYVVRRMGVF